MALLVYLIMLFSSLAGIGVHELVWWFEVTEQSVSSRKIEEVFSPNITELIYAEVIEFWATILAQKGG